MTGLIASGVPEILVPEADRLRIVVLVHMPLGDRPADISEDIRAREQAVLSAAISVVTTSDWTRRRLLELYALPAERVSVAEPGVDYADLATGSAAGGSLLCVAAVIHGKGHDVLLSALASITDLSWRCQCIGSLDRDPEFVAGLRRRASELGLTDRVSYSGAQTAADLAVSYGRSDLLVLPSRAETYGMVVTEALAHGIPVVASDVGGVTQGLGHGADGNRPGRLVPSEDPDVLGASLREWLVDVELRERWRSAARDRRESLSSWSTTSSVVADVLAGAQQADRVRV